MSTADEPLEGIKAYKGTIESAAQTRSVFDYIHLGGGENVLEEKLGEGNVYEGPRVLVIPSNPDKKRERIGFDTPYSTLFFF